jgi:hypothetical protein
LGRLGGPSLDARRRQRWLRLGGAPRQELAEQHDALLRTGRVTALQADEIRLTAVEVALDPQVAAALWADL